MEIRKMIEGDLARVIEIEKSCFSDPWSYRSFLREVRENPYAHYFSAFNEDRIVGYIGGWLVVDELHITNLAVSPDYRKLGIGERLLDRLIAFSIDQGAVRATLEVRRSNLTAIRLYRKKGFYEAGYRPAYYRDNFEDALIMWKQFEDNK